MRGVIVGLHFIVAGLFGLISRLIFNEPVRGVAQPGDAAEELAFLEAVRF